MLTGVGKLYFRSASPEAENRRQRSIKRKKRKEAFWRFSQIRTIASLCHPFAISTPPSKRNDSL